MCAFCYRPILHAASERSPVVCCRYSNCTQRHHFLNVPRRFTSAISTLQRLPGATESSLLPSAPHQINRQQRHRPSQHIQNP
jgi:hypothetical protein